MFPLFFPISLIPPFFPTPFEFPLSPGLSSPGRFRAFRAFAYLYARCLGSRPVAAICTCPCLRVLVRVRSCLGSRPTLVLIHCIRLSCLRVLVTRAAPGLSSLGRHCTFSCIAYLYTCCLGTRPVAAIARFRAFAYYTCRRCLFGRHWLSSNASAFGLATSHALSPGLSSRSRPRTFSCLKAYALNAIARFALSRHCTSRALRFCALCALVRLERHRTFCAFASLYDLAPGELLRIVRTRTP